MSRSAIPFYSEAERFDMLRAFLPHPIRYPYVVTMLSLIEDDRICDDEKAALSFVLETLIREQASKP